MNGSGGDEPAAMIEELLEFLYLMPVGVVKFDRDGAIDLMNPVATALLLPLAPGGALENVYTALSNLMPDLARTVRDFAHTAGTIVDKARVETCAGGATLILSITVNRVDENVHMAIVEDVTKIALAERKIFDDREKFRAIFDNVHDYAIYTIDGIGKIEEWNHSLERYGGWLPNAVLDRDIGIFFPTNDPNAPQIGALLAEAERIGSVETEGWRLKSDGSKLWENTVLTALPNQLGAVRGFTVVARDMTERKRTEDAIKLLATVDPLTGAFNRRHGDTLIAAEWSRYQRSGQTFAALMLDVDHFKSINDRFGHPVGDAVLCALVQTVRNSLRTTDVVARWGGEEFLLVLSGADAGAATTTAERVRAALAATEVAIDGGPPIRFTVSIGVAVPAGDDPQGMIRRADVALYAAKSAGRNRVTLAE